MKSAVKSKTVRFNAIVVAAGLILAAFFPEERRVGVVLILAGIEGIYFRTISYDRIIWRK